jgi:hypothetical protein
MKKTLLLLILGVFVLTVEAFPADKPQLYSTWDAMEMDRLASLWLIKRFIDPGATFRFYPQGTMDMEGVQVDTPTSPFKRTQQLTAYESLLKAHAIRDPALRYIGEIVRDVEINIWGVKKLPESQGVNFVLKGLFLNSKDPHESLEKGFIVMESLYKALDTKK